MSKTKTLFFTAKWCAPCQSVKRVLRENPDLAKRIEVVDVETPEGEALMGKYKVRALPTFRRPDGERHVGAMNKRELVAFLEG
jgi:thiol-disulfide isomerase/thioredoxin